MFHCCPDQNSKEMDFTNKSPRLAIIGSGRYAMALISSFSDAVDLGVLQICWVLPNSKRLAVIFDGHGWNPSASSITIDPTLTSLKVAGIVCGRVGAIHSHADQEVIYCGDQRVICDAVAVALDPFHDMGATSSDSFMGRFISPRPLEELNRLSNVSNVELNLLCTWQADQLAELVARGRHRRYIQSSIAKSQGTHGDTKRESKPKDLDEEEANADDDDDMEFDRPNVLELRLPLTTTKLAESLLSTSQTNPPELVFFAMNEGERSLSLREANIDNAELDRVCSALRVHYLVCSRGSPPTMLRDVSSIDLSHNALTTLNSVTETFLLVPEPQESNANDSAHSHGPVRSMLRHLDVSHNPLEPTSVVAFLSALLSAESVSHLTSLNLCQCGLEDGVGAALSSAIARMPSLVTLDISNNNFSPQVNRNILQASRHFLKSLNVSGLNLRGCDSQLEKLFRSAQMERVHCSNCGLEDSAVLCVGTGLMQGQCRASLRVLDLSKNPSISSDGVKFLFECITAGVPSDQCRVQELLLEGCGGVGVHEIVAAACIVQHCRFLETFTFSTIYEERLCLQVFVDCVVKYGNALTACTIDSFVSPPSRCNTLEATASNRPLSPEAINALQLRIAGNQSRRAAREEQLASRTLSIATATDLAADATRSLPPASGGIPTQYLRVDDSENSSVYANQLTKLKCDEYRYSRWLEAMRSAGSSDTSAVSMIAGYFCGSINTWNAQWAPFLDALVTLRPSRLPSYMNAFVSGDGSVVVDSDFVIDQSRKIFMVGCGARTSSGSVPFALSTNSGVHDSMYSRLVLPIIRQNVLRKLAPQLAVPIPRTDIVGKWMDREDVPSNVLRQKLLESLSLAFVPVESYIQQKSLKFILDELAHRVAETRPHEHIPLHTKVQKSEQAFRDALLVREAELPKLPEEPIAAPPPAASGKKSEAAAVVAPPAPIHVTDPSTSVRKQTSYDVVVAALESMTFHGTTQ